MAARSTPTEEGEALARAARQAGLVLDEAQVEALAPFVGDQDRHLEALRRIELDSALEPDAVFLPDEER